MSTHEIPAGRVPPESRTILDDIATSLYDNLEESDVTWEECYNAARAVIAAMPRLSEEAKGVIHECLDARQDDPDCSGHAINRARAALKALP